jgi:hypothetical protein
MTNLQHKSAGDILGEVDADEQLVAAYLAWKTAYEQFAAVPDDEDDDPAYDALCGAADKVMSFTPVTARGAAILTIVFTCFGNYSIHSPGEDDLLAKLEQWAEVDRPISLEHLNRAA